MSLFQPLKKINMINYPDFDELFVSVNVMQYKHFKQFVHCNIQLFRNNFNI